MTLLDTTAIADTPPAVAPSVDGPSGVLNWRVLHGRAALDALGAEWSALIRGNDRGLCMTPEWVTTWHQTIAPKSAPHVVTGRDACNRLRVLWPLQLRRTRPALRVVEPMGGAVTSGDRLDPAGLTPSNAAAMIRALHEHFSGRADCIRWAELSRDCPLVEPLRHGDRESRCRVADVRRVPVIDLPRSFTAYLDGLSANTRQQLRRKQRLAARRHGLVWRLNDEDRPLPDAVQAFIYLHQRCWNSRGQSGNFIRAGFAEFVMQFCRLARQRGWLRLHRLCDHGATVAAMLVFHFEGRAYYYQSGWHPDYAGISPGMLCVARAVEQAVADRCTAFDFMRGNESYKRHWTRCHERTLTLIEPLNVQGRLMLAARDGKGMLRRGLTRLAGPGAWHALRGWSQRAAESSKPSTLETTPR